MTQGGLAGLDGKVAIVTGAGAGLGRAEALALARGGAAVVVGDVAPSATEVVEQIRADGGRAELVLGDSGDRETADALMAAAERFGGLHIVVNNAGFCRDKMLFSMSDDEFDSVVRVHLRGHFLLSRNACAYWRAKAKASGESVYGRVVNTSSEAFLFGSVGQPNYAAAKAGIAALTIATARGLGRYGVRANAICPRARTAMTEGVFGDAPDGTVDPLSVDHVARFVRFLAGPESDEINGQVFVVHGGMVALMAPPSLEQRFDAPSGQWDEADLAAAVGGYFADRDDRMFVAAQLEG
ncbi:Short-chain dehydrogenase/reductase SDR OS=Tsukamurella paurometabola (strain ATCC 8368 / DSM/ CCUG 35730 / CIP 100753 / JCM 10117 / KCTC 9821 / NBRC 16120/ NCIMB 702349 / NCTC 13040) OX=521096 GN=Tpau_3805 PE=3 SV=1 [Tsukamurella paurometabola]|uniref:Short-chain dehydrogenase/reductase SDR n=1 Tax=Tsukamurella paurometabola (strain ATCC 8368 / DSM 20162 / CCUG 35730 / CIP 100753 / JCM 10117 / KCTC 9821 / NBRC 16120 / NCIMB 702349 / NCTC 13040) TaxID=521096 RepID=D5UYT0_TSUPD|nr:3-oxoacyl-ACP reductase [Tsukamurella paurometabola]ADG80383.1 short-chain dehydrogenase/reductase SDR [Tsukamurella paurometabola DSM 20162]SUP39423.1 Putative short-chain type dehydrogenase/reductase Rv0148 [Tsukamurella paurometabola]